MALSLNNIKINAPVVGHGRSPTKDSRSKEFLAL
jgi:hypothetical protein